MAILEKNEYEVNLHNWVELEKNAVELIHEVGTMWFDKSVELTATPAAATAPARATGAAAWAR